MRQRRKGSSKLFPGRSMCVRWKSADAKRCRPASYGRDKIRSNRRRLDLRPSCVDKKIAIGKRGECLAIPLDGIMQVLSRTAAGSPHYANRISDMYFLVRSPDKSTFQVPVCGFKAVFVSYLDV